MAPCDHLCTCLRNILKAWILFVLRHKALGFETWISMLPIWGAGNLILSCQMMDNSSEAKEQESASNTNWWTSLDVRIQPKTVTR